MTEQDVSRNYCLLRPGGSVPNSTARLIRRSLQLDALAFGPGLVLISEKETSRKSLRVKIIAMGRAFS